MATVVTVFVHLQSLAAGIGDFYFKIGNKLIKKLLLSFRLEVLIFYKMHWMSCAVDELEGLLHNSPHHLLALSCSTSWDSKAPLCSMPIKR